MRLYFNRCGRVPQACLRCRSLCYPIICDPLSYGCLNDHGDEASSIAKWNAVTAKRAKDTALSGRGLCHTCVTTQESKSFTSCSRCNRYYHNNKHCSAKVIIRTCQMPSCDNEEDELICSNCHDSHCWSCGSVACSSCRLSICNACDMMLCRGSKADGQPCYIKGCECYACVRTHGSGVQKLIWCHHCYETHLENEDDGSDNDE
jgi:hypothetical protein